MSKYRKISIREKEIILGNYFKNNLVSETDRTVGRCKTAVSRVIKIYQKDKNLTEKKKSGKSLKLNKPDDICLVRIVKQGRFKSSRKLFNEISSKTGNTFLTRLWTDD